MHSRRPLLPLLAALAALALQACSHGRVSASGEVRYGKTAEEDYEEGVQQLADGHPDYAIRFFEHVRVRYPFSKLAALADLGIADVRYQRGEYGEAADAYAQFVKLHPNHEKADYAAFRIGASYWEDGPSTAFFLPPEEERDLTQVRQAAKALDDFLQKYPTSSHRAEAQALRTKAADLLERHEWFVVEFYAKRDRWPGVAARLEGVVHDFPGSKREGEALFRLAEAYVKMDERFKAQQRLQELIARHPDDPRRSDAEKLLASLR